MAESKCNKHRLQFQLFHLFWRWNTNRKWAARCTSSFLKRLRRSWPKSWEAFTARWGARRRCSPFSRVPDMWRWALPCRWSTERKGRRKWNAACTRCSPRRRRRSSPGTCQRYRARWGPWTHRTGGALILTVQNISFIMQSVSIYMTVLFLLH